MKLESKCLLAGAMLSVLWLFLCPKFTTAGDSPTIAAYKTPANVIRTEHQNGRTYQRKGIGWESRHFKHLSPEHFWGGEIVIWTSLLGFYLHRREINKDTSNTPMQETP
jgi:hypothetical protein